MDLGDLVRQMERTQDDGAHQRTAMLAGLALDDAAAIAADLEAIAHPIEAAPAPAQS